MRIRNMRNIKKKTNAALLISCYATETLVTKCLQYDFGSGSFSHKAPAYLGNSCKQYMILLRDKAHKRLLNFAQSSVSARRFLFWN